MKKGLITGVTRQDGSGLAELLLKKIMRSVCNLLKIKNVKKKTRLCKVFSFI